MKTFIITLLLSISVFAELDSVQVTWTDPADADLAYIRIMKSSNNTNDTTTMVKLDSVAAGVESYIWGSAEAGTTYWFATLAVDDGGNVSYYSNTDSVTTVAGGSTPTPIARWVYNSGITNDANNKVTAWVDNIGGHILAQADTNASALVTDSSIWFDPYGSSSSLEALDSVDVFDFGTNDFSIRVVVYIRSGTNYNDNVADKYTQPGWRIQTSPNAVNDQLAFTIRSSDGDPALATIVNDGNDLKGKWVDAIITFDRNVGVDMYENGSVVTSEHTTEWTDYSAEALNGTGVFQLGKLNMGYIKVLSVYDTALTSAEVTAIYGEGLP